MDKIEIYRDTDNNIQIDVKFEKDTVWLNQYQMSNLFGRERSVITKHINNVFRERELNKNSNVQNLHIANSDKPVAFYSLDVIISIGYRVKSFRGTQFRRWATKRLKDLLIEGYTINQKRLEQQSEKIKELKNTIDIISRIPKGKQLEPSEASGLIEVINQYSYALDTLDEYDYQKLTIDKLSNKKVIKITYEEAINIVKKLKDKFSSSELFGVEKDKSFKSSIETIYQTFDKKQLYPSIEEKCAMLLYLVIKNHSFVDGNKRIAASIFIWFLSINNFLFNKNGSKKISDNELVALCLMIASSNPKEKDIIIKVIIKLLSKC